MGPIAAHPPQGRQGRLASLRSELLPSLSPGRAPCAADRLRHEPCRLSMRRQSAALQLVCPADARHCAGQGLPKSSTRLKETEMAKAGRPNILILWGDDIGWWNISYN